MAWLYNREKLYSNYGTEWAVVVLNARNKLDKSFKNVCDI